MHPNFSCCQSFRLYKVRTSSNDFAELLCWLIQSWKLLSLHVSTYIGLQHFRIMIFRFTHKQKFYLPKKKREIVLMHLRRIDSDKAQSTYNAFVTVFVTNSPISVTNAVCLDEDTLVMHPVTVTVTMFERASTENAAGTFTLSITVQLHGSLATSCTSHCHTALCRYVIRRFYAIPDNGKRKGEDV